MEINKTKIKKEFEYNFTYLAGDGRRMNPKPEITEKLLEWVFNQIETHLKNNK